MMTNANPLVSVLMTAYNREKYIGEAIESVLASSYSNFELIVIDDCSTDKTLKIAQSYKEKDQRIKVYLNAENLGDYPNRNRAASYATGYYLKYIDADDMIYPNGLEIMVRNMSAYPDAGWGVMSLIQDDDRVFPFQLSGYEAYKRHYLNTSLSVNSPRIFVKAPLSVIIKKEVFDRIGGFRNVRHYGDSDLWHRLAMHYPVVLMQDGLVWWRGHEEQEAKKRKAKINIHFQAVDNYIEHVKHPDCPLNTNEKNKVVNDLLKYKIIMLISLLKKLEFKSFLKGIAFLSRKKSFK